MRKTKVTVGVCVRDCESFVREAINSIINQDFSHDLIEVIFVDDGSQDDTLSIIENHISKIDMKTKIFHQERKGLGSARNMVVKNACGEYIVWVDGDMLLSTDYIRTQVEFMDKNPKVGIAKGQYTLASGPNLLSTLEIYSRAASKMVDFNYTDRTHAKSMGTGGCIYRTKVIRQIGGFDKDIKGYGEDFDAEFRTRMAGWLLSTNHAQFTDYERRGVEWRQLWTRYLKRGYDSQYFLRKNKNMMNVCKMLPFAAFFAGLLHSYKIYKLTEDKVAFLLPLQYVLESTAWFIGFIKSWIKTSISPEPS